MGWAFSFFLTTLIIFLAGYNDEILCAIKLEERYCSSDALVHGPSLILAGLVSLICFTIFFFIRWVKAKRKVLR